MARMRLSFPIFRQPRAATFGAGSRREIASCINPERAVVFLSGNPQVRQRLVSAWGDESPLLDPKRVCVKPRGEPTREAVRSGAAFLAGKSPQQIVAIGGGSVLDWCRLSWAEAAGLIPGRLTSSPSIAPDPSLEVPEFWLVPTTYATGAEASAVTVMMEGGLKIPVVADCFLATRAVLDAQFLQGLDRRAMAEAAGDALSHAIESFVSILQSRFAEDAAVGAIERIFAASEDASSRNDLLMEAGYLGGVAASNASVGIAHAFAHSVARYDMPHGRANAYALPVAIETYADTPAMGRLLNRLHLQSANELLAHVREAATVHADEGDLQLADQLSGDDRDCVVDIMLHDVCLRTNPVRVGEPEVKKFLDQVAKVIRSS